MRRLTFGLKYHGDHSCLYANTQQSHIIHECVLSLCGLFKFNELQTACRNVVFQLSKTVQWDDQMWSIADRPHNSISSHFVIRTPVRHQLQTRCSNLASLLVKKKFLFLRFASMLFPSLNRFFPASLVQRLIRFHSRMRPVWGTQKMEGTDSDDCSWPEL